MLKLVEINLKYCFMFVGQNYLRGRGNVVVPYFGYWFHLSVSAL